MRFTIQTGTDNQTLRTSSEVVSRAEFAQIVPMAREMVRYVRNPDHKSCGLAAPQIGVNKRIIAVSLLKSYSDETFRTIAMINPEMVEHSSTTETDEEGCLSLPDYYAPVARFSRIRVSFLDTDGKPQALVLSGLSARIVQHEVDHLNGVLFSDIAEPTVMAPHEKRI